MDITSEIENWSNNTRIIILSFCWFCAVNYTWLSQGYKLLPANIRTRTYAVEFSSVSTMDPRHRETPHQQDTTMTEEANTTEETHNINQPESPSSPDPYRIQYRVHKRYSRLTYGMRFLGQLIIVVLIFHRLSTYLHSFYIFFLSVLILSEVVFNVGSNIVIRKHYLRVQHRGDVVYASLARSRVLCGLLLGLNIVWLSFLTYLNDFATPLVGSTWQYRWIILAPCSSMFLLLIQVANKNTPFVELVLRVTEGVGYGFLFSLLLLVPSAV